MNIKRVAVVGLGVLLWAAQAIASQWDDQITQWKKESTSLKADQIPQLEEAARNGDVRAIYLLYLETDNSRFEYSKRSSINQLRQWSQRVADAGNPIGMRMLCYLLSEGVNGLVKDDVKGFQWCLKASQVGFVNAMVRLGGMYRDGVGVTKDEAEAVKWFRKGAESIDGESFGQLGYMYETGIGVTKDLVQAAKLYRSAADLDVAWVQASLGKLYLHGLGVNKDEAEAAKWFLKGSNLNDGDSISSLGYMYQIGLGVVKNETISVSLYRKGADLNNAVSIHNLGLMYRNGTGIQKNEREAMKWFNKSAELNIVDSFVNLGNMYEIGEGVTKNYEKAIEWYRKAAEANNSTGMEKLGWMYRNGLGVTKQGVEAARWYRKAADTGNADAMANLATHYEEGNGVPKDLVAAFNWNKKSADAGSSAGMSNLGLMYSNGRGVAKDQREGVLWYRKAIEAKSAEGMFGLGYAYLRGEGVEKDIVQSRAWMLRSLEAGSTSAMPFMWRSLLNGDRIATNDTEAMKWLHKAIEARNSDAMVDLGILYRDGRGVIKDESEALSWFRKAAEAGHSTAEVSIGQFYKNGEAGLTQDYKAARTWYEKALVKADFPYTNTAIGELYANGLGVKKDDTEASNWYKKAVNGGESVAMIYLAENYKLGRGVVQNLNESARLYIQALNSESNAKFKDIAETGAQRARRLLDTMLAAGEITDPEVLREVRALSKPAPKAEWVQAPQTTSEEEVTFKVNVVDGGGGIGDVSFKLNGVALNVAQGRNASVIELANTNLRTFTFRLPPGKHDVEVIAYNAENLINWTSLKSTVTSTFKPIRKPQLHAVIVGINDYENDKLKLRFANNDATEVAKVLKTSGEKLYDQVHVKLLNTRSSTGKTAILQAIKEAASKAQTEDVFIFYVAGHGQNFERNGYHMLTADVGVMTDKAIQERSISAQELQSAIYDVPSGKKVVLLDTCQSGGGLDASKLMSARSGPDDQEMVKLMNRKSGAIVLAAAESQQDAMEGYQGHGVFTFALLEVLQGKADTKGDGFVSTYQLQEFIPERTYQLAQQAFNGKKQSPYTSGDNGFPFLKWK